MKTTFCVSDIRKVSVFLTAFLLYAPSLFAQVSRFGSERSVSTIVYHGKVIKPDGNVLEGSFPMTLKVYSPDPELCLLWAEKQTVRFDKGGFSVEIGRTENRLANTLGGAGGDFNQVFVNNSNVVFTAANCALGNAYSPETDDDRLLSATVDVNGAEVTVEHIPIKSVPYAMQAKEIWGYGIDRLMKISDGGSTVTFTSSEVQSLKDLLGGEIIWDLKSRRLSNVADPVSSADGANKGWVLSQISGLGAGSGSMTTVTGTAPVVVANGSSSPSISITQAGSSTNGYLSSADWTLFNNKQPASSELTGLANAVSTGILQRTGGGSYATLGTTPPLGIAVGNLTISQANNITSGFLSNSDWSTFNSKLSVESDPKVGVNTTNFLSKWNGSSLVSSGVIESIGNVGIGTTSPQAPLDVTMGPGSLGAGIYLHRFEDTGSGANIKIRHARGSLNAPTILQLNDYTGYLDFQGYVRDAGDAGDAWVRLGAIYSRVDQLDAQGRAGGTLMFATGSGVSATATEKMRISGLGNVGIGASDPDARLTIAASSTTTDQVRLRSMRAAIVAGNVIGGINFVSNDTNMVAPGQEVAGIQALASETHTASALSTDLIFKTTSGIAQNEVVRIKANGNVGIGTTSPGEKLEVSGNVKASAYLVSSDNRLKYDIMDLKNALGMILKIRGVSFKWKQNAKEDIGFIAQQIETVLPELVHTDKNSGMKSVQYSNVVAVLVAAMQEQQNQIAQQKNRISVCESKMMQQQDQINRQESRLRLVEKKLHEISP